MMLLHIETTVPPENRNELNQAFRSILEKTRADGSLLRYGLFSDMNRENGFLITEEWGTREALEAHMRSDWFCVMMGALQLLGESTEIRLHSVHDSVVGESIRVAGDPRSIRA